MEALVIRARSAQLFGILTFLACCSYSQAASHRTENFIVSAPTKALAAEIAEAAERYRSELAIEWLGKELPRWNDPCPIKAKVSERLGAGGATSFLFETHDHQYARPVRQQGDGLFQAKPAGRPFGWEMTVQGSRKRVLDSVLPHEVTHTIFATHFGRPLPRWADEGACTTVEHPAEKAKQHRMLYEFLKTDRGIAFNQMFSMNEYPADILPLYSQGFSLARFLIAQGGKRKFVDYIGDGLNSNNWTASTKQHYGFGSLSELQVTWLDWVRHGSPEMPAQPRPQDTRPELPPDFGATPQAIASRTAPNAASAANSRTGSDQLNRKTVWTNAAPASNQLASTNSNRQTGTSWYAQQRQQLNSRSATDNPTAKNRRPTSPSKLSVVPQPTSPSGTAPHVASRLDEKSHQREVLLEWGTPSPILTPKLSSKLPSKLSDADRRAWR